MFTWKDTLRITGIVAMIEAIGYFAYVEMTTNVPQTAGVAGALMVMAVLVGFTLKGKIGRVWRRVRAFGSRIGEFFSWQV